MTESLGYKAIKYTLADQIEASIKSAESSTIEDIILEKGFESDCVSNIADIKLELTHDGYRGFAFEVKSICDRRNRTKSIYQLTEYSRAGYHPVLVAPSEFYDSADVVLTPKSHTVQYQRLIRSLNADIIDVDLEHGVSLSPVSYHRYDSVEEFLFDRTE